MRYIETFITMIYIDFNRLNSSLYIFLNFNPLYSLSIYWKRPISFNTEHNHFSPQDSTLVLSLYLTELSTVDSL